MLLYLHCFCFAMVEQTFPMLFVSMYFFSYKLSIRLLWSFLLWDSYRFCVSGIYMLCATNNSPGLSSYFSYKHLKFLY